MRHSAASVLLARPLGVEEDGDALARHAKSAPELGHGHAVVVEGTDLAAADVAECVEQVLERARREVDEDRLLSGELPIGSARPAAGDGPVEGLDELACVPREPAEGVDGTA